MDMPATLGESLLAPGFTDDPYPTFARLRELGPVWFEPWQAWVVTRYADVRQVLRLDGRDYTATGRVARLLDQLPADTRHCYQPLEEHFRSGLLHSDPPDHTRMRRVVAPPLTSRSVGDLAPRVREVTEELLGELHGQQNFDLVAGLAFPLPATVVAGLIGIPVDAIAVNQGWAADISGFFGNNRPSVALLDRGLTSVQAARSYISELAERRRRCPGDDLISRLVDAGDIGQAELLNTCVTFLAGGHETTSSLISGAVSSLSRAPEQEELLRAGQVEMAAAIEEFLRFESPNQRIVRIATKETQIGDTDIGAGEKVMLLLGAANRDHDVFPDAEALDLTRDATKHVAFAGGVHLCAGAYLARLEATIAISALLRRYRRIHVTDERLDWAPVHGLRMLRSLHVHAEPS